VDFLNPVAETMTGWTNEEAQGKPLQEVFAIFNEQTGAIAENPVERVLRENVVVGLANHTVLRARNGREVAIADSAAPIRDARGELLGVILVFHDEGEKREVNRQVEEALRRAHFLNELGEATRSLREGSEIMSVTARMLGEELKASRCAYAEVNPSTCEFVILDDYTDGCASTAGEYHLSLFGMRAFEDMNVGRTLVVRDVDAELSEEGGAAMFNAIGIKGIICCPLIKDDGLRAMMALHQTTPRNWTAAEISLVEEVVDRCWATIERARAETESKEQARRFELLSKVVTLHVWTADPNGELDYINEQCAAYFGKPENELLGTGWTAFVHPDDLPAAAERWGAALASGERYETEFRLRSVGGKYRWFITRAESLRGPNGRVKKWFGSNTDIQDLKAEQERAEQLNRSKDVFLATLSHELRTPLTPVVLALHVLNRDDRLPGDVKEDLEMVTRNIGLEVKLIDDLLDVTSIIQGKLHLDIQRHDAHQLISRAAGIVEKEARAKEITVETHLDAERSSVSADGARFQQVVWNLLRNAIKFTPPEGRVTISTSDAAGGRLRIAVQDTGVGIEADMLDRIFTPFEQGGLAGDHRFGGMGLGLTIAKAIVAVHGGTIRAESAGKGQGSTFIVEVLAQQAAENA
jgi:PAS domain S-box-containing protein